MEAFHTKAIEELFRVVTSINNKEVCEKFFEDICTVREVQDLSQRLQVAKGLHRGKSYQEISKETGASTATISRVNRCLMYGSGGYRAVIEALEE